MNVIIYSNKNQTTTVIRLSLSILFFLSKYEQNNESFSINLDKTKTAKLTALHQSSPETIGFEKKESKTLLLLI